MYLPRYLGTYIEHKIPSKGRFLSIPHCNTDYPILHVTQSYIDTYCVVYYNTIYGGWLWFLGLSFSCCLFLFKIQPDFIYFAFVVYHLQQRLVV